MTTSGRYQRMGLGDAGMGGRTEGDALDGVSPLDALRSAAFSGDVEAVLRAVARQLAVDHVVEVAVGLVEGRDLSVSTWPVDHGRIGPRRRSRTPLTEADPLASVVTSARALAPGDLDGEEPPHLDAAVPVLGAEAVVGAVGVRTDGEGPPPALEPLEQVAALLALGLDHVSLRRRSRSAIEETVTVLAAMIEGRDAYTESHCVHIAEVGLAIGVRMGLPQTALDRVTFGGLLHDIGKIAVPDAVLTKAGPLSDDERSQMQAHASIGEDILQRIGILRDIAPIVGQHHERFDGQGYPRGHSGEAILVEARVLSVVDAFDAMTTTRPYRPALPWPQAVDEIRLGAGAQFDPDVVGVFLRYLEGEEAQWSNSRPV